MIDSGKQLAFDNRTNTLGFSLTRHKNNTNENDSKENLRSIKTLSSGERQILIAITYLCFLTKSSGIFVIDEPELSLHLAWQQQLVEGLKAVKPAGCQIILATHTPEIVGRAPDKVVVLAPQYQDNSGEDQ
jgi:predicted ATPase